MVKLHVFIFFFNDTATTEIYTLSLHDALPISDQNTHPLCGGQQGRCLGLRERGAGALQQDGECGSLSAHVRERQPDRKSTRLNSSHANTSHAVFCLKKKKLTKYPMLQHFLLLN